MTDVFSFRQGMMLVGAIIRIYLTIAWVFAVFLHCVKYYFLYSSDGLFGRLAVHDK